MDAENNYTKTLERWRRKYAERRRFSFSLPNVPRLGDHSIVVGFRDFAIQIINGIDYIVMYDHQAKR